MANKVNVDLDMNVKGYVDGMNQATNSTAAYETETRKVQDSTVNLNKELRNAKREVQNLAAGYAKLNEAARNSTFGREMKRQLDEAKKKAAEYIDLQGDLSQELKNLASDTATFDTLADGLSGLGNTMSAVTGVMGIFTDDTQKMTKAITYFTTAESIATAAIKVKNLLQRQSSLMLGIAAIQQKALTAAENLDTAAKSKNAVAAGAATVAQKAFNAVAKANPYVLLATAIIGVASAFAIFSSGAEDATAAQNKLSLAEENGKKASETYSQALASEYSNMMTQYTKLKAQWASLANDGQRKKFISEHKNELNKLGLEIKNVTDAEGVFNGDTSRIVEAFQTRARAAALAAKAAELYRQEMEIIEKAREWRDSSHYRAGERALYRGPVQMDSDTRYSSNPTYNNGKYYMDHGVLKYTEQGALEDMKQDLAYKQMDEAFKENQRQLSETTNGYAELIKSGNLLSDSTNDVTTNIKHNTNAVGKQITTYKDAIAEYDRLNNDAKSLKKLMAEGRVDPAFIGAFNEEINAIETKMNDLATTWHINPAVEVQESELQKIKKKISELETNLQYINDPESLQRAQAELKEWKEKQEAEEIRLGIKVLPTEGSSNWYKQAIDKLNSELGNIKIQIDGEINPEYINKLKEINALEKEHAELTKTQEERNREAYEKQLNDFNLLIGAAQNFGQALSTLGSAFKDKDLQIAGTIAQAIANITLAFSEAILHDPGKILGPLEWISMSMAATAQLASMIGQIKSIQGYATGGVIGGHSYYGDKILARLNSKELVLNTDQQKKTWDMMDPDYSNNAPSKVEVTGDVKVKGSDLMISIRNLDKKMSKLS